MSGNMNITLKVWRQKNAADSGSFATYQAKNISPDMSFLEMMDVVNEDLAKTGIDPVAFDHDCREGICGTCSMYINGRAHGPLQGVTTCQLHMRSFNNGDTIVVEPWRATAFPVLKDLVVDRNGFEKIQQAGGFVSVNTGSAPDANSIPVSKKNADEAFNSAACIGCGACVSACKNSSGMLFLSAKVSQYALLPQGQAERNLRVVNMLKAHDEAGFGSCTNTEACEAECPKGISVSNIARLNRDYMKAMLAGE